MNVKNTTRHHGRKPAPLIYCLRSLRVILRYTISNFFFGTVLTNEFIYFYRNDFPIFGALGSVQILRNQVGGEGGEGRGRGGGLLKILMLDYGREGEG